MELKTIREIIERFINSMIDGAIYLKQFRDRQSVIDDLNKHYENTKELIKYTKSKFRHGFSIALCCDFLKELSPTFNLPKPDVHIMEILAIYNKHDRDYYKKNNSRAFECIDDFIKLVNEIKKSDKTMTAYKLDRQIWLCCTGNFFLDNRLSLKELFIDGIK